MVAPRLRFSHEPLGDAELPPRTRRILDDRRIIVFQGGTTSAYAENTGRLLGFSGWLWNYLRVRGEYSAYMENDSSPG